VAAREGRDVWAKRVSWWRESGLTAKEFAAESGMNAHTLAHWAWKLGAGGDQAARRRATPARPAHAWVEVITGDHRNGTSASAPTRITASSCFELVLPGGRTVRVPPDFDAEALGRLLAVIDAR
jgi:hypothetical protein